MGESNIWGITGNSAEVYHACFISAIIAPWAPTTLALANPQPGERVLDVACGTGVVTRLAAQAVGPAGKVVGLDISPEMLAVARSVNGQNGGATIEWREGSADALPFADGGFDAAICQLGLMFFPDRVAALREMRRVLARGGRVAVMTWGALARCPGNAAMVRVWGQYFGAEQAAKFEPPHSLHDPVEVRCLLEAAGFAEIETRTQMGRAHFPSPRALACSYGALAGLEADAATRDALCADLAQLLQDYCGDAGLDYPIEAVLARASV